MNNERQAIASKTTRAGRRGYLKREMGAERLIVEKGDWLRIKR
jgi:hypothetical protein